MTSTALTPTPRTADLVAALALYTDTLDLHRHGDSADAGRTSLRHGAPARTLAAWQAARDAAAVGQAPYR
ncbi:hypothetical protein GGR77_001627 [Xanthomonas translucens]